MDYIFQLEIRSHAREMNTEHVKKGKAVIMSVRDNERTYLELNRNEPKEERQKPVRGVRNDASSWWR